MRLSNALMMDQELFKCKPAIMRAFQAAKAAHKVNAESAVFTCAVGCIILFFV
jgi:hypothetical protein